MPLDPSIPLQFRPPQVESPLQTIGGLMQLKDALSQVALRNAQTQQAQQVTANVQAEAAQKQRDLEDTKRLTQLVTDPNTQKAFGQGDFSPIWKAGISTNVATPFVKNIQDMQTKAQALQGDKATFYATGRKQLADTIQGLDPQDDNKAAAQWNQAIQVLGQQHPELTAQLPMLQAGPDFRDKLNAIAATNGVAHSILENSAALEKEKAATAASQAEAGLKQAQTPGATATSEIEQRKADLQKQAVAAFQANPQAGVQQIDTILPASLDATANTAYKSAFQSAMQNGGPDAAQKIVEAAATHAASIGQAINPLIRKAEVSKAVQVASATAPIEVGKAIATAKALRQGDNPAVAGVAPAAVGQVQNQAIKLDEDYIKAKSATDAMGHLLDLAESGNKAAGSNVPLVGVETLNAINGIKRINSSEISQYGSAGSLLDNIKGKIGKLTVGEPIPADLLKDIRELHQTLGQQSYQNYTDSINALNNRTGAKFTPSLAAPNISKGSAATPKFKVGDSVMYQGKPHTILGIDAATGKLNLAP